MALHEAVAVVVLGLPWKSGTIKNTLRIIGTVVHIKPGFD